MSEKEENEKRVLRDVNEVLDKYDVEFWLDGGTALGVVRDKKFIEWDNDIDLGAWDGEVPKIKKAAKELNVKGFSVLFSVWKDRVVFSRDGIEAEINLYRMIDGMARQTFFLYRLKFLGKILYYKHKLLMMLPPKEGPPIQGRFLKLSGILFRLTHILPGKVRSAFDKLVVGIFTSTCKKMPTSVPAMFFKDLEKVKIYGMELKVPNSKEKYLAYKYGDDWKTPKKDYVYYEEDCTIQEKE